MITRTFTHHLHRSIAAAAFVTLAAFGAAAEEPKAAILLPGSANDQSWNALGYSILKSLESHGFKTAYSENVADADEGEALRDYASHGYLVVMGHGASSRRWSRWRRNFPRPSSLR
jgi:basic membrane protein A and related proteins